MNRQAGFTLVELLLAASIMLVVLFATLTTLDGFVKLNVRTTQQITSVDGTRNAMSRLTRDLRDATAATPSTTGDESVITRAGTHDLVMRRINPFATADAANVTGVHTVRWCLEAAAGRLHRMVAAGVAAPAADCPGSASGWTDTVQAQQIANGTRPVFTYDDTVVTEITSVDTFLTVDADVAKPPREATLTSGVFLRNQNRRPTASFSYVTLGGKSVQLNGQDSRDPEGGILSYEWRDGDTALPYTSAVASYTAPSADSRSITLTVRDVDGLSASQTQIMDIEP